MTDLHQATTFNQVLQVEGGGQPPLRQKQEESKQPEPIEADQIDSSSKPKKVDQGIPAAHDDEDDAEMMSINDMIKKTDDLTVQPKAQDPQRKQDNPLTEVYI